MNVKNLGFILMVLWALLVSGAASFAEEQVLSVTGGDPVIYCCDNGDRLVARYYSLSDDSLHFVKVLFPDGKEYTLPQVMSASGARYTDDFELSWWIKGDEAYVEKRDDQGEWRSLYGDCRVGD
jgi:membrane-bound inhibitor of C-type lysozyme